MSERRLPQDGAIAQRSPEPHHRLSRQLAAHGLRREDRVAHTRSGLGAAGHRCAGLHPSSARSTKASEHPQGMILVTGPTGSGKTVTLYTGLNILNQIQRNICTAEDRWKSGTGVNQVNVLPKVGLDFASALRAFLRQDPDVVMVGEIRDLETAEIAVKASQTGHLVLSTVHTNSAAETLTRRPTWAWRRSTCQLGEPDHRSAPGAAAVQAVPPARGDTREALLREGFTEEGGELDGIRGGGLSALHPGLQGPRGHLRGGSHLQCHEPVDHAPGQPIEFDQLPARRAPDDSRSGLLKVMQALPA
ncbi:hypothetical protein DSL92_05390 [Billgrantia gudaonensis]|uniref:Bacterial type II secretion system protein E domain-containing protein n=1 Tax=Billgrantia gudaonensis TaxID=376427 RepID=A0A432JJ02_9GAMM|nr:hypothetical protein DSL92_05390 [Halomonas gudaonensis]